MYVCTVELKKGAPGHHFPKSGLTSFRICSTLALLQNQKNQGSNLERIQTPQNLTGRPNINYGHAPFDPPIQRHHTVLKVITRFFCEVECIEFLTVFFSPSKSVH